MLGKILRREREAAGLSQETLAARARIDRSYLSELERDVKSPTVKLLLRLCDAMDVSASEVLGEVEKGRRRKPREQTR